MTVRHDVAMQLDVESMRAYLAVLDWGSMTRAAEQLGLTQSAVSWKIKRLEGRVGRPLLIRDGHELRPTHDGRILLDEARDIVDAHDRVVQRLQSPDVTGRVRIGSNDEVGASRMAGILGRFKRMYPSASIEFIVNQSRVLGVLLERGKIDVAVLQIRDDVVRPDDQVLWTDELRWATHRDMPYETGVVPLISYGENGFYRPVSEPILERNGIRYRYTVTAPTSANVRAAVEAGLGVAVLGERFITGDVVEWARAAAFEPLPAAKQVVRTVPGEPSDIAASLISAITDEFRDLPERQPTPAY
jgi:DNA-binding transcriptional LysR family regulator